MSSGPAPDGFQQRLGIVQRCATVLLRLPAGTFGLGWVGVAEALAEEVPEATLGDLKAAIPLARAMLDRGGAAPGGMNGTTLQ